MAGPVKIKLKGINEVMKSQGVQDLLNQRARAMAADAGDGFEAVADNSHRWVARAWVRAETLEAMRAEATDKVLTKALGRARAS